MKRLSGTLAACVMAAGTVAGCASTTARVDGSGSAPLYAVTLLDTVILPAVTRPPDGRRAAWLGSLSGLARDQRSGRYLAVIDDPAPSRVAWLDITARDGHLIVRPGAVTPIRPKPGVDERAVVNADLEAVVAMPDGTWVASEEGHLLASERGRADAAAWPPMLLTIDASLQVTRLTPWPDRFALGAAHGGVRDNQGFEALTRTPDGRLIAGLERPLYSDLPATLRNGRAFSGGQGGPGRLVELVQEGGQWEVRREWVYPLDATAVRDGEQICDDGENGLTELLALDASRVLALERACLLRQGRVRNTARLYLASTAAADDVSPRGGVPIASARPITKTLLVDFDALVPQWPGVLATLDNFEALAFGPPLPDGHRTVIVTSDDNFRPTQNTVFAWFKLDEGGRRQEIGDRR